MKFSDIDIMITGTTAFICMHGPGKLVPGPASAIATAIAMYIMDIGMYT